VAMMLLVDNKLLQPIHTEHGVQDIHEANIDPTLQESQALNRLQFFDGVRGATRKMNQKKNSE
jgi:hypothetical protein